MSRRKSWKCLALLTLVLNGFVKLILGSSIATSSMQDGVLHQFVHEVEALQHENEIINQSLSLEGAHRNKNRELQEKFSEINSLLTGVTMSFPPLQFSRNLGSLVGNVLLKIDDLVCYDFHVGNIIFSHSVESRTLISNIFNISGITTNCDFLWSYDYGPKGNGIGGIKTEQNELKEVIVVVSDDFDSFPPKDSFHLSCAAIVNVKSINIQGITGLFSGVITAFFSDLVENSIRNALCDEVEQIIPALTPFIIRASDAVNEYAFGEIPGTQESSFLDDVGLINLMDADFVNNDPIINSLFNISGSLELVTADPENSPSFDLGINIWLREHILNPNGFVSLTPSELGLPSQGVILHEATTIYTITTQVKQVDISGIDSITRIDPIIIAGPQTIETGISWNSLMVNMHFTVEARLRRSDQAFNKLNQNFNFHMELRNVETSISLSTALDEKKFDNLRLELGSILGTEDFFPCVLSTTREVINVMEFHLKNSEYQKPFVSGFDSDEVLEVASSATRALHSMYGETMEKATTVFFAKDGLQLLNKILRDYMTNRSKIFCHATDTPIPTLQPSSVVTKSPIFSPTAIIPRPGTDVIVSSPSTETNTEPSDSSHSSSSPENMVQGSLFMSILVPIIMVFFHDN